VIDTLNTKPHDTWFDQVIVNRAAAGHFHLVTRPLSFAESVAVIGPLLDEQYRSYEAGCSPEGISIQKMIEQIGWHGELVRKLVDAARPGHRERMAELRASYKSLETIATGKYRSHRGSRTVTGHRASSPERRTQQKRWNSYGLPR